MKKNRLVLFAFVIGITAHWARALSANSFSYVGCFSDAPTLRDFEKFLWSSEKNSPEVCALSCSYRGYSFAGVQNATDCYCGVSDSRLYKETNIASCNLSCSGDVEKKCGGPLHNSIYLINRDREIKSGARQNLERFAVHATDGIHVSTTDSDCGTLNCFEICEKISQEKLVEVRDKLTIIRTIFYKLSDVHKHVTIGTQEVHIYSQTLVVDTTESFDLSLIIYTRKVILVFPAAEIQLTSGGDILNYKWKEVNLQRLTMDSQFMKLSYMCASELFQEKNKFNLAWSIMHDIVWTTDSTREQIFLKKSITAHFTGEATLMDNGIHFLSPFSDWFITTTLQAYNSSTVAALKPLRELEFVDEDSEKRKLLRETVDKCRIPLLTVTQSIINTKFEAFKESHDYIQGLTPIYWKSKEAFRNASKKFWKSPYTFPTKSAVVGEFVEYLSTIFNGIKRSISQKSMKKLESFIRSPFGIPYGMLPRIADHLKMMEKFLEFESQFGSNEQNVKLNQLKIEEHIPYFLTMSNLQVNEEFSRLKMTVGSIMKNSRVMYSFYTTDYLLTFTEFINSAIVLMNSLFQHSIQLATYLQELYWQEHNQELMTRVSRLIEDDQQPHVSETGELLSGISDIKYSVRVNIFNSISIICNLYFYERQTKCSETYKVTFSIPMIAMIYRIQNHIMSRGHKNEFGYSAIRTVTVAANRPYPTNCVDCMACPMKFFGETRELYYSLNFNNSATSDIDSFLIREIEVKAVDAIGNSPESIVNISISSNGIFSSRKHGLEYKFIAKPFKLLHTYHAFTGAVLTRSYTNTTKKNITELVSPFTNWMIKIYGDNVYVVFQTVSKIELKFKGDATITAFSEIASENEFDYDQFLLEEYMTSSGELRKGNTKRINTDPNVNFNEDDKLNRMKTRRRIFREAHKQKQLEKMTKLAHTYKSC